MLLNAQLNNPSNVFAVYPFIKLLAHSVKTYFRFHSLFVSLGVWLHNLLITCNLNKTLRK